MGWGFVLFCFVLLSWVDEFFLSLLGLSNVSSLDFMVHWKYKSCCRLFDLFLQAYLFWYLHTCAVYSFSTSYSCLVGMPAKLHHTCDAFNSNYPLLIANDSITSFLIPYKICNEPSLGSLRFGKKICKRICHDESVNVFTWVIWKEYVEVCHLKDEYFNIISIEAYPYLIRI